MAVARKRTRPLPETAVNPVSSQRLDEASVLAGSITNQVEGVLIRVHRSLAGYVNLPASGTIVMGEDGMLFRSDELRPSVRMSLITWQPTTPFVSGNLYFASWSLIVMAQALAHAHLGGSAVSFEHVDGDPTIVQCADWGTAESIATVSDSLASGIHASFCDADLIRDILDLLEARPYLDTDEVLEGLSECGWEDLTVMELEPILNDESLPVQFLAHFWFFEDDVDLTWHDEEPLAAVVSELLAEAPDTAAGLWDRISELDIEVYSLDELYDVLYDPATPMFKRAKAWYLNDEIEGENS